MILIFIAKPEIPEPIQQQLIIVQNQACLYFRLNKSHQIYSNHHYPFHSEIILLSHWEGFYFSQGSMEVIYTL